MDRASSTEQQVEALARLVVAERNVEKAAHHAYTFIRRLMEGLFKDLPDQAEIVSAAFQAISSEVRPLSAADTSTCVNAPSGGTNKASDAQDISATTRVGVESILNPIQHAAASDVQQSDPTCCPSKDTRITSDFPKSKCKESASRAQSSLQNRLLIENPGTGGPQHSQHAVPSTDLSGSENTAPNNDQVSQEPPLADELDSVAPRPEGSSLNDAAERMSIQPFPSLQMSSLQAKTSTSGLSQSSDPHLATKLDARVVVQKQQTQGIRHEKRGGVIRLYPTAEQYENFPALIKFARELGADSDGLCMVILPQIDPAFSLAPPKDSVKVQMSRFITHSRKDGTFAVVRTEQSDDLAFDTEEISPAASTDELVRRFELLAQTPNGFENVRYCVDLDVRQEDQRRKFGLPLKSPIFPLEGNRLSETTTNIPGIHTPYAYVSEKTFGAPFAIHVEDCCLFSVSYLYSGEKIWFVLEPEHGKILEERLAASGTKKRCSQFLRHSARYVTQSSLDDWGIYYKVVRQMPGEVIITFPGAYHQGFSTGFTCAEAVNYADQGWNTEGYSFCNRDCPRYSILAEMMAQAGELQQDQVDENTDTKVEEGEQEGEGEEQEEGEGEEGKKAEKEKGTSNGKDSSEEFKGTKRKAQKGASKGLSKRRQTTAVTKAQPGNVALPRKFKWALDVIRNVDSIGLDRVTQHTMALLFCNIGSPGAIQQLKTACAALREKATLPDQKGTITAYQAVRSLDTLDDRGFAVLILRRYYLARLVQCRQDAGATYKSQRAVRKCTKKQLSRPETLALEDLMSQVYPSLSNSDEGYKRKYKALQNRISSGNNWHLLVEEFGYGILALVPTTDDVPNSSVERLAHQPFQHLVSALRERRGRFLHGLSERVSCHLLSMISGQEPTRKFLFEEEDCNLLEETEDSPRLIELCSLIEG